MQSLDKVMTQDKLENEVKQQYAVEIPHTGPQGHERNKVIISWSDTPGTYDVVGVAASGGRQS